MVLVLVIPSRQFFGLKNLITRRHVDNMAKILLATGMIVGYAYAVEYFMAWYSGSPYEQFTFLNRATGPIGWAFWIMVTCNVFIPQLMWIRAIRTNLAALWLIAVAVNVGMWFERFVIILSLTRDFLPSSWGGFMPTWVDIGMLVGSFGLFFTFFLLFVRYLPMVAMAEVKGVMPAAHAPECDRTGVSEYRV
jgi:molybdopterin-containing oxidoreductase family membrane subunit